MIIDLDKDHIEKIFNGCEIHSISFYPKAPICDYSVEIKPPGFEQRSAVAYGARMMEIQYHAIGGYSETVHAEKFEQYLPSTYVLNYMMWKELKKSKAYKITQQYGSCRNYEKLWSDMIKEEILLYRGTFLDFKRTSYFPTIGGELVLHSSKTTADRNRFLMAFNMLTMDLDEGRRTVKQNLQHNASLLVQA